MMVQMTPALILAVIGGLIYGSFLNVLLYRLPEGKGINGRSACRSCGITLAWYDLVPVFSYIVLRGRCRHCRTAIHLRYPLVELSVGLALGAYFLTGPSMGPEAILAIVSLLALTSLFFFDLFYFILPDALMFPMIILYAFHDLVNAADPAKFFLTALLAAAFFAILHLSSRGEKLGFGDVKLVFLLGLIFGYPLGFIVIVLGIWLATLVSIVLLLTRQASRKDPIPLGAFLSLAAIVAIIFNHEIIPFISLFQ